MHLYPIGWRRIDGNSASFEVIVWRLVIMRGEVYRICLQEIGRLGFGVQLRPKLFRAE